MDPRCVAIHPSHRPLPLHPPSPSPCVQCAISTLTNPKVLYTLRRSACVTLTAFANDSTYLCDLGASYLSDLLHSLLNVLLTITSSESELSSELTSVCMSIASNFDKSSENFPASGLSTLLFSECAAAIMLEDNTLNVSTAIALLARLSQTSRSNGLNLPFESLPDDFAHHVLMRFDRSPNFFSYVNLLLEHALGVMSPNQPKELLRAVASSLPTPRDADADRMFLTVVLHIAETNPKLLLECDTLPIVIKAAFMSSVEDLRKAATKIIATISDDLSHAKWLGETAVFEYIIESLRVEDPSNVHASLLQHSARSLSALAHKQAAQKWVYSLDVVLSVAPHLGANIQDIEPAVHIAIRDAPTALFSGSLIDAVVSFAMLMLAHENDATQTVRSICSLLERLRPEVNSLHTILTIVESTMHAPEYTGCGSALTAKVGKHFLRMATTTGGTCSDELVRLGHRLTFSSFHGWAAMHKEALSTFQEAISLYSVDELACIMDMFATILDYNFVTVGSYDIADRCKMVSWCWKILPPKVAFACSLNVGADIRICSSVRQYCRVISIEQDFCEQMLATHLPITESAFLTMLATELDTTASIGPFQLLHRALELRLVENVCLPELVLDALMKRVNQTSFPPSGGAELNSEYGQLVRMMARLSTQYGLTFPKRKIPETILIAALEHPGFSFSLAPDRLLFQFITLDGNRSNVDVAAWEIFADSWKVSVGPQKVLADTAGCILDNASGLQSAVYAISQAKDPIAIAECLVSIVEGRDIQNTSLERNLERSGVMYASCQSLRDVESSINHVERSRDQTKYSRHQQNMKTGISYLTLLSRAACFSDSRCWSALTHAVCDVFVRGAGSIRWTTLMEMLLTAALNYLVATILGLRAGNTRSLRYIWQRRVMEKALHMLKKLSMLKRVCNQLTSAICSFSLLALNFTDRSSRELWPQAAAACLKQGVRWDRLLSSFPIAANIESAFRIAKCCELFVEVLLEGSRDDFTMTKAGLDRTMIVLATASCSVFVVLRNAALVLLRTLLQTRTTSAVWQTCLTVHHEVSHALLQKVYDKTKNGFTMAEFSYLKEAVGQGHLDRGLMRDQFILVSDNALQQHRQKSDEPDTAPTFHKQVVQRLKQRRSELREEAGRRRT